jgi:hypothetical protein
MGRYFLILAAVWGTFALLHTADLDPRLLFWAALLPSIWFTGLWLLHDRQEP